MVERQRVVVVFVFLGFISLYAYFWFIIGDEDLNMVKMKFFKDIGKSLNANSSTWGKRSYYFHKTLEGSGVILQTKGGIGNQLFQYACSYALARKHKKPLYNYIWGGTEGLLKTRKFLPKERSYALDMFQMPLENIVDESTTVNLSHVSSIDDFELFYGNYSQNDFLLLNGGSYCAAELYFIEYKSEILQMIKLRQQVIREFPTYVAKLEKEILESSESVAVHVRRGDYITVSHNNRIPISYQRNAIQEITQMLKRRHNSSSTSHTPTFFVFSDDINFVKRNFSDIVGKYKIVFVSGHPNSTSLQDFYLMSKCKHFIFSTSSFAWWAAYVSTEGSRKEDTFSDDPIVIVSTFNPKFHPYYNPNKFLREFYKSLYGPLYWLRDWIVINPFTTQ